MYNTKNNNQVNSNKNEIICYERWRLDDYNDQLWDRVVDVNSYRTNMYVQRPQETGLGVVCSEHNFKGDCSQIDDNNLRNYTLESQLQRLQLINTRDLLTDQLKPICNTSTHSEQVWGTDKTMEFDRFSFRRPTKAIYSTCDQRLAFFPSCGNTIK